MNIRTPAVCLSLTLCACFAVPQGAAAQIVPPPIAPAPRPTVAAPTTASPNPVPDVVKELFGDFRRLPSGETVTLLSLGAMAAFIGQRADRPVGTWLSNERALNGPFEPGNIIGGAQVQIGGAVATYTLGRITHSRRTAAVGADLLRAQILSHAMTDAIKLSARRTRPDGTHLSFPSGHTSASFASATVLQRHFGWKVGVPAMGVASYVAAARIQEKRHFLSDVAFGAAIGLAAGRTVTIGRGERRFALAPMAAPGGAGVSLIWVGR